MYIVVTSDGEVYYVNDARTKIKVRGEQKWHPLHGSVKDGVNTICPKKIVPGQALSYANSLYTTIVRQVY